MVCLLALSAFLAHSFDRAELTVQPQADGLFEVTLQNTGPTTLVVLAPKDLALGLFVRLYDAEGRVTRSFGGREVSKPLSALAQELPPGESVKALVPRSVLFWQLPDDQPLPEHDRIEVTYASAWVRHQMLSGVPNAANRLFTGPVSTELVMK